MAFNPCATTILRNKAPFLACWVLLAGCGGESLDVQSLSSPPPVPSPPAGPELGLPAPIGSLDLRVTDPLGGGLAGARVTVFNEGQTAILASATTGEDGSVLLERLPGPVRVSVWHDLGYRMVSPVEIEPSGTRRQHVVVQPWMPVTVALVSATIPLAGISADRTELDLEVRLVASAHAPFQPSSYFEAGWDPGEVYLYLRQCSIRLGSAAVAPACENNYVAVPRTVYAYQESSRPDPDLTPAAYAAMLLLERGPRRAEFDPASLQWLAARHFVGGARNGSASAPADMTTIAGFAGSGAGPDWPPLMLPAPLWTPPLGAAVFQPGTSAQMAAIDTLATIAAPPGARAPVIDALRASYAIMRDYAPSTRRRAVVAVLGGGDDAGRMDAQRQLEQAALRREQDDAGVHTILVAGRLDEDALERGTIADLAATLEAPLIYAGYPRNYGSGDFWTHDGLYAALGLASELLRGDALPAVTATFRVKADASSPFVAGALLRGTLYLETDQCPMGCWELPVDFAAEVP